MDAAALLDSEYIETPAMVYSPSTVAQTAEAVRAVVAGAGASLLYSVKAQSFVGILESLAPHVAGFSAASLFEARLCREVLGMGGTVHLTQPGLSPAAMPVAAARCDYIALNSFGQTESFQACAGGAGNASVGLRVNAGLNFVADERYAPCRSNSKLGVPVEALRDAAAYAPHRLRDVRGLHLHHNCGSRDLRELHATVCRVLEHVPSLVRQLEWVNLGGGYMLPDVASPELLEQTVQRIRAAGVAEVFVEPGTCMVEHAACLVTSVVDVMESGGGQIAVLDTTVSHMPDVFSYQRRPAVLGARDGARHEYLLAGASCLAGDLFGTYAFEAPLRVGSRVVFPGFGDYTSVKASMFNGINFPSIYALSERGEPVCRRRFTYQEFAETFAGRERAHAPDGEPSSPLPVA